MIEVKQDTATVNPGEAGMANDMILEFEAMSSNEALARMAVAAFITPLNPTMEEISDVKTAVSEAVTNAIIHGYNNTYGYGRHSRQLCGTAHAGRVWVRCRIEQKILHIEVEDTGVGIENLDRAMEPLFTTKPELERSGMGFAFMEAFMDDLEVESELGKGTTVRMKKRLGTGSWLAGEE